MSSGIFFSPLRNSKSLPLPSEPLGLTFFFFFPFFTICLLTTRPYFRRYVSLSFSALTPLRGPIRARLFAVWQ